MKFIKKIWYRLRYDRRILAVLILFVLLFIALGSFYFIFYKVFDAGKQVQFLRSRPYLIKLLPVIRTVRKISDILYLPYCFKKSELPIYELYIKPENIKKMNESLPLPFTEEIYTDKTYVPAKFWANGREYNVDIRYRGDNSIHWDADKKSYLIKFNKDDLFNGFGRLSFIIPDDRKFIIEPLNNYRAQKLGLLHPSYEFATLKINNRNNGLYFVVENWGQEMLAKWEAPDSINFYGGDDPIVWFDQLTDFNFWKQLRTWTKKTEDSILSYNHFSEPDILLNLLNNTNDKTFNESVFDLIDKDNFFNWLVLQNLANSNYSPGSDERLFFNNSLGKFFWVPWDIDNFPFNGDIDRTSHDLITRILSNPKYMHERNKLLWQYISDKDNLDDDLDFYDQTYKKIKAALYQDRMKIYTNTWADNLIRQKRELVVENFKGLREILKKNRALAEIRVGLSQNYNNFNKQNVLAVFDIKVDNFSELLLKNLTLPINNTAKTLDNYLLYYDKNFNGILDSEDEVLTKISPSPDNDKEFTSQSDINVLLFTKRGVESVSLFEPYKLTLTSHRFFLVSKNNQDNTLNWQLNDVEFVIENAVTKKKLKDKDITKRIVNEDVFANFFDISKNVDDFLDKHPFFTVNKSKKELILKAGSYYINQTIIIPKDYSLRISAGTTLSFASKISLISYSPVLAQGTKDRPIKIMGQDKNKPWGVFAVLGPHQKENIFEYCLFEYGGEAYVNGVFYSGQLAIHYMDAIIKNCRFQFANGDDGLNVKNGKVEIRNNIFNKNKFDGVDLDWVTGVVVNNYFINNGQETDGDALDLSGSKDLIIFNNKFKNSADKCLSVGEDSKETTIIFNNLFSGCDIGIAVKDNSRVKIINNVIVNNKTGISVYEKKPVFGGAWPVVINTVIWNNDKSINLDEKSNITTSYSNIQNGYAGENNFNQKPIFQNSEQDNFLLVDNQQNFALIKGGYAEIVNKMLNKQLEVVPIGLFIEFYDKQ